MTNLIDKTEFFVEETKKNVNLHNNLIRYAPQIKQLKAIGGSVMKLPLFSFVRNPFSAEENRSIYYNEAVNFENGFDNDFESLPDLIEDAKKYFLDQMKISAIIIKNL